jgi:hypothetical protein
VSSEPQDRSAYRRLDVAIAILLAVLAFAVRIDHIGFNSLSEDETAKWQAIQEYRQGHFAAVNSEHPMILKMLAWGSLEVGKLWNGIAGAYGFPSTAAETWLRLPNVLFGAVTAAILFLFCRQLMGTTGSFSAGFFWAVSPLVVALNRITKEETAFTCFTLLACYFYCKAKKEASENRSCRWVDLSAMAFGLATASQYMIHLFGLNHLAWYVAGRRGLDHRAMRSLHLRMFLVMGLVFLLANPFILSPATGSYILHWLHHDGIRHTGYNFNGTLYPNFPSHMFTGVPWYFYLWMLLVKTPIPILAAMVIGGVLLLLDRKTLASCFFLSLGLVQLIGLSVCGAKWLRYSVSLLPFLYLAAGYAVQAAWTWGRSRKLPFGVIGAAAIVVLWWPLLELFAWRPYYPLYLNTIGGGTRNITRYFSPDEVSEFDTRLVAQQVCPAASPGATLATARPNSMTYYLESCGRSDIHVVPLYDPLYVPQNGDLIVLEPSRRFVETQRFFDLLERSGLPHREIHVGPVATSTIYRFQGSDLAEGSDEELGAQDIIFAASQDSQVPITASAHNPVRAGAITGLPGKVSDRQQP